MANRIKGITIEIGGDTTKLDKALQKSNKTLSETKGSLRDVERLLKLDPGNTELLAQKQRLLGDAVAETRNKLDTLKRAAESAGDAVASGKMTRTQYDALQREIAATTKEFEGLTEAAKNSDVAAGEFSAAANGLATKAKKVSDAMRPVTAAIGALGAAAFATIPATEELRESLSMLDNNARLSGVALEAARGSFEAFVVATGEVDSAVEATSNLLQAGFTESNLQIAVENLTGAYLAFPDTMKIESLADSLQETLATGEATGQFGELLDRLGVGAKNFSETLSLITSESDKMQFAMDTLAQHGMADTYNAWVDNNQELVANREATLRLQETMADFAASILPLVTEVTNFISTLLEGFNSLPGPAKVAAGAILAVVAAIGPLAGLIGNLAIATGAMGLSMTTVLPIILAVVAALAALAIIIAVVAGKEKEAQDMVSSLGDTVSGMAPNTRSVPHLASGGVARRNSPFLAVVGDNTQEDEIIAPYSEIKRAASDAMLEAGMPVARSAGQSAVMQLDGRTFARLMVPYLNGEEGRLGVQISK